MSNTQMLTRRCALVHVVSSDKTLVCAYRGMCGKYTMLGCPLLKCFFVQTKMIFLS